MGDLHENARAVTGKRVGPDGFDDLVVANGSKQRGVIADVADPETEDLLRVAIDDVVGQLAAVQIGHAQVVLFRLIAGKDCHALGIAEAAFEASVRYARERVAFGRPIGEFQGMRWKLATMYHDIEAGRGLLYRACATADPFPDPLLAATAKVYCNEMSVRVTSDALQVFGGYGFTDEYLVSRLYRGARYGSLGGGTSETLRDLIGKRLMEADVPDGIFGLSDF